MNVIPWAKLAIPENLRASVDTDAPYGARMAAARGALPATTEAQLGMLYVLACDADAKLRSTALATLERLPGVPEAIHQSTHPKILELLVELRPERAIDEKVILVRNANDRTATIIAGRADSELCAMVAENHERLLLTPEVIVALHQNPACGEAVLERAVSFLRMQRALPPLPETRPTHGSPRAPAAPPPPAAPAFDVDAEIEAALAGRASPMLQERQKLQLFDLDAMGAPGSLQGFAFDFKDPGDFALDMLEERAEAPDDAARLTIEKKIAAMSVGQKLKLAYLGNKSVRSILIRDRNKMVSVAVVKSGRLTDAEVLAHAGNRNLPDEALREIATNREWTRKYPVKVALVNNPKCPPSVAVGLVNLLQIKDLDSLSRNRNVSSVVFSLATKLAKQKRQV